MKISISIGVQFLGLTTGKIVPVAQNKASRIQEHLFYVDKSPGIQVSAQISL